MIPFQANAVCPESLRRSSNIAPINTLIIMLTKGEKVQNGQMI